MNRPRVIVSVVATVDGRVAVNRDSRLVDPDARRRWESPWPPDVASLLARRAAAIEERHHPTVVLEGSGTFVPDESPPLFPPSLPASRDDFIPVTSPRWFAVVDGRGRVPWSHTGDDETRLLVVTGRDTPDGYLAALRELEIPYLVAGASRVDLQLMLLKFASVLGASCVLSEAGGGLNGALLRAGLIDELHVITVPALVGGLGTPSVADGPPLGLAESPVPLRTVDVQVGSHGSIWAHYEIARPENVVPPP
jgi:2,5-diamino-6-(ribosylamino)-4(3H)-pyrimidinone 5'-phosphate reductase